MREIKKIEARTKDRFRLGKTVQRWSRSCDRDEDNSRQ